MRNFIKYRSGLLLISYILIGIGPWISNYTHQHGVFVIKTWISNYIIVSVWCIYRLMPNFNGELFDPSLILEIKLSITSHCFIWKQLPIHAPALLYVKLIFVSKMAPWLLPTSQPLFFKSGWISIFILRNNLICMLNLCGPVTPNCDIHMGQHWSR